MRCVITYCDNRAEADGICPTCRAEFAPNGELPAWLQYLRLDEIRERRRAKKRRFREVPLKEWDLACGLCPYPMANDHHCLDCLHFRVLDEEAVP